MKKLRKIYKKEGGKYMKINYTIMLICILIIGSWHTTKAGVFDTIKSTAESGVNKLKSLKKTAEEKGIDVNGIYNTARKKLEEGLGLTSDEETVVSTVEEAEEELSLLEQSKYTAKNPRFLKYIK
jgi:hypothetical protein